MAGFGIGMLWLSAAFSQVPDPEQHIKNNGYHSSKIGEDGKTRFFSFTENTNAGRISTLESEIEKLPKHSEVQRVCDSMRGGVKAALIEKRGIAFDVAAVNYGYKGATIACVMKYMHANRVGTQLIFVKKGADGMYMLFIQS